jgi:oxygen-independent coproporphyrinogen-3 oxidase
MIPIVPLGADGRPKSASRAGAFAAPGLLHLAALPPLTLYIHFPWCVRKCPYCDFNSHEHPGTSADLPEAAYLEALTHDLQAALPLVWGRRVHAVFIGGGTPSLLSVAGVDTLLGTVRALLPLEPDAEITLEANPGTLEAGKFAGFRQAGVTRLSIGVQSFDGQALVALGRIHDPNEALRAVEDAQRSFENVNLDLMYALPNQSLEAMRRDLQTALAFAPAHLSVYHLTIEPNTVFAKYPPRLPADDSAAAMQEEVEGLTRAAGYGQYEISAYAQPGRQSRHNLNYWNFGDYLGIGAGAHSKLSFPERIVRQARLRQPAAYLERAGQGRSLLAEESEVSVRDLPFEFMLNALRLVEGVPLARFAERTGLASAAIQAKLDEASSLGLLECDAQRIRPTERGRRFLNDLQVLFLPDE